MVHEFSITNSHEYNKKYPLENMVVIDDKILLYIMDSLNWVKNISDNYGINYCGITLFNYSSAIELKKILSKWIDLFSLGNEVIVLCGEYCINTNNYERNIFKKKYILNQLSKLIELIDNIKSNQYLIHFGL